MALDYGCQVYFTYLQETDFLETWIRCFTVYARGKKKSRTTKKMEEKIKSLIYFGLQPVMKQLSKIYLMRIGRTDNQLNQKDYSKEYLLQTKH